ncbi:protein containing HD superfamily phosphodieaserase, includes HD domain of RNase Y [Lentimicrobium saccharophilum]|uniref:Protein containing HD superfamily phosphodieaserase, includes HD domain of RNase Y n=1 Tax=Lentimicrobium saccharophilum TaxID=1678841 RepID=A0A0S7BY81_9BACT|nr:HD domain-containing protein [Lentimicrobium saccharophilum]GAP43463.1 protein containing HD superfamily phosphodieaserase, includes HD domain of RNase Y [Lentimicrobium saccharophilum]
MDKNITLINNTIAFVKETLKDAEGGHDWFHIERVWKNTRTIAESESCNMLVAELGALLHDIADAKFHNGDEEAGPALAREFLTSQHVDEEVIYQVEMIIRHVSFGGGNTPATFKSPELSVVQDADRLDAMGAIGIARAFHYGGHKNRQLYNPGIPPDMTMSKEKYRKSNAPTLNHFYEKLLLLKDLMNTETGRRMASRRHAFMQTYLIEFLSEWEGG